MYRGEDLKPTASMIQAVAAKKDEDDLIGRFCETIAYDLENWTPAGEIYKCYQAWCETQGIKPLSQQMMGQRFDVEKYPSLKRGRTRGRFGFVKGGCLTNVVFQIPRRVH